MVLEAVMLQVRTGHAEDFEDAFRKAARLVEGMSGFIGLELHRCLEMEDKYLLLIQWETVEDHMSGFRQSPEYERWKALLHHLYDPFPTVEHFEQVL